MPNRDSVSPRRVLISHDDGKLLIHIQWQKDHAVFLWNLAFFAYVVAMCAWMFGPGYFQAFSQMKSIHDVLIVLPFPLLCCMAFLFVLWSFLKTAFDVEDVVVWQGMVTCKRNALLWKRNFEISVSEVRTIAVKIPWHQASGCVQLTSSGGSYTIGNDILPKEANEIAEELRRAIPTARA